MTYLISCIWFLGGLVCLFLLLCCGACPIEALSPQERRQFVAGECVLLVLGTVAILWAILRLVIGWVYH